MSEFTLPVFTSGPLPTSLTHTHTHTEHPNTEKTWVYCVLYVYTGVLRIVCVLVCTVYCMCTRVYCVLYVYTCVLCIVCVLVCIVYCMCTCVYCVLYVYSCVLCIVCVLVCIVYCMCTPVYCKLVLYFVTDVQLVLLPVCVWLSSPLHDDVGNCQIKGSTQGNSNDASTLLMMLL